MHNFVKNIVNDTVKSQFAAFLSTHCDCHI